MRASRERAAFGPMALDAIRSGRQHRRHVHSALMIHPYDNQTQTRWDHGEFKVQINTVNSSRPMGFCDGSEADLSELRALAEAEGAEGLPVQKKILKSGREIWTLG